MQKQLYMFANVCKLTCRYSRTSRKRPPKMSSGGGRLRKTVAYEGLDHNGSKYFLTRIW